MEHYLDNSATTAVSPKAARKACEVMTENYGNPSSLHYKGMLAERELETARKIIASSLSAAKEEIFFTSGGTEANNLALFGAAYAKRRRGKKIITTSVEHDSVIASVRRLEEEGFEAVFVPPQSNGSVRADDVLNAVDEQTVLVSVMLVNNETGAIQPAAEIFESIKQKNSEIICHTDAVQAFGKIRVNSKKLNADLISVSAHKVHAPKGCGALFVRKGIRIVPRAFGGEQERKIRPGTEPLPLIAAFGEACSEFDIDGNYKSVSLLSDYAKDKLSQIDGTYQRPVVTGEMLNAQEYFFAQAYQAAEKAVPRRAEFTAPAAASVPVMAPAEPLEEEPVPAATNMEPVAESTVPVAEPKVATEDLEAGTNAAAPETEPAPMAQPKPAQPKPVSGQTASRPARAKEEQPSGLARLAAFFGLGKRK